MRDVEPPDSGGGGNDSERGFEEEEEEDGGGTEDEVRASCCSKDAMLSIGLNGGVVELSDEVSEGESTSMVGCMESLASGRPCETFDTDTVDLRCREGASRELGVSEATWCDDDDDDVDNVNDDALGEADMVWLLPLPLSLLT